MLFYFFCMIWLSQIHGFGSIDLRSMQAEHWSNIVPPSSRSANYIVLRYYDFPSEITVRLFNKQHIFDSPSTWLNF